jgi:predicted dehydrogenase
LSSRAADRPAVRLAVIGCGAVTELYHLPAARLLQEVEIVALADKDLARAKRLGERYGVSYCTEDYRQLPEGVDGVIVALPNYLHAPVTTELLSSGVPVLVEKPMALTVQEAEAMIGAANISGATLQVGLMYRFCHGARLMKRAVDEGWLGALQSFSLESGFVYDWPVTSGFILSKERAGGGQLVDIGSHMLDLLLWWLGEAIDVEYKDDSLGGVEADCWLSLTLQGPSGPVQGTVALSRLRKLSNMARLTAERFTVEYDLSTPATVRLWPTMWDGEGLSFESDWGPWPSQSWTDVYAEQLRAFAQSVAIGDGPIVSGDSVLGSVALIERCYRERQPLQLPWMDGDVPHRCGAAKP